MVVEYIVIEINKWYWVMNMSESRFMKKKTLAHISAECMTRAKWLDFILNYELLEHVRSKWIVFLFKDSRI